MKINPEIGALTTCICGGQGMLRNLPLEGLYRDTRCGSLKLPRTAEVCLD